MAGPAHDDIAAVAAVVERRGERVVAGVALRRPRRPGPRGVDEGVASEVEGREGALANGLAVDHQRRQDGDFGLLDLARRDQVGMVGRPVVAGDVGCQVRLHMPRARHAVGTAVKSGVWRCRAAT